jgi:AmmeMemoRadiSam system protein B
MDTPLPKLRAVEAFPVAVDARSLVCLRDPHRYATTPLLLPYPAYYVLTLLDGRRSEADVQRAFTRQYGTSLDGDDLRTLLATLDTHHFLDSQRFDAHRAEVDRGFHATPTRVPAHAGTSYPDEPTALRAHLAGFFTGLDVAPAGGRALAGVVAPHVDLRVGGRAYGHAYAAVAAAPAMRYVVLGTSHAAGTSRFAATRKDFATPLGTVTTDRDFLDRLAARVPERLYADELLHRTEHAIEFQAVMLRHVLGDDRPFTIVPILVTSFHDLIASGTNPADDLRIGGFLAALRATLAEDDVPTVIVAGVDFAHVGAKFGDRDGLTDALLALATRKDRALLAALEAGDPRAFFAALAADVDRTRICGAAPLLVFLELLRGTPGRVLCHETSRDDATRSAVTYASLAFEVPSNGAVEAPSNGAVEAP